MSPSLQPSCMVTSWTWPGPQASDQRGSNLGEGPKPPEQRVFSQHEEAWKGLTHPAASPSPAQPSASGRVSKQPVWFLSSPSLPWPGGRQEVDTPLLGTRASLGMVVSALCRGLGTSPHTTPSGWAWGRGEEASAISVHLLWTQVIRKNRRWTGSEPIASWGLRLDRSHVFPQRLPTSQFTWNSVTDPAEGTEWCLINVSVDLASALYLLSTVC